jgi:hypothetical protein
MSHASFVNPVEAFDWEKKDWQLEELLQSVVVIQSFPNELAKLLKDITPEKLNAQYREGSWTVNQIVHHLADSHMNAWIRTKQILHADNPTVMPYDQDAWASGVDYQFNYEASYVVVVALHQRWSLLLLEALKTPEKLLRTYFHPEHNKTFTLAQLIAQYGWHCRRHLAQLVFAIQHA